MSDGTKQYERTPAALAPERIGVDELGFVEQVAMSAGLAASLHYFDLDNQPAGDWSGLFAADETFVLARILGHDRAEIRARLLEDFAATPTDALVREIGGQARLFDTWLDQLERIDSPSAEAVGQLMRSMVKSHLRRDLASLWPAFHELVPHAGPIVIGQDDDARIEPAAGFAAQQRQTASPARERLRSQLASIAGAIARLQDFVREELPRSLESGRHDPAAGMLIAFLRLYGSVQSRINGFTRRHTDFYYRDCLYARPRAARPDRVHLVFRRDGDESRPVAVRRGANFSAGKDASGKDIVFRADGDLAVGTARVTALCTLQLERDPLISPEREFRYATRAVATTIATAPKSAGPAPCWPLFGGIEGIGNQRAQIGLAVASRQLFLKEGRRRILLTLSIKDRLETDAGVRDIAHRHAAAASAAVSPIQPAVSALFAEILAANAPGDPPLAGETIATQARNAVASLVPPLAAAADPAPLRALLRDHCEALLAARRGTAQPARIADDSIETCTAKLLEGRAALLTRLAETHAPLHALFARYAALEPDLVAGHDDADRLLHELAARHAAHCAAFPDRAADRYLQRFLAALTASAPDTEIFHARLGGCFRHWLLAAHDRLTDEELRAIRDRRALLFVGEDAAKPGIDEGDPLCLIHRKERPDKSIVWLVPNRDLIFDRLVNRLFTVKVTTANGWFAIEDAHAVRTGTADGFTLSVTLHPQDPAVIGCQPALHGDGWETTLPIMRLELNADARVYGYDLIGASLIASLEVAVEVAEVRNLALSNQLGRIDPSKPFNPFGPLPDLASYLIVGSAEMARKNLTAFSLAVKWSGLPRTDGGFADHYLGYESRVDDASFAVGTALLRDGQWKKLGSDIRPLSLFARDPDGDGLLPQAHLRIDEVALDGQFHRADDIRADVPYAYDLASRNGFFKFQLVSPASAFGHAEYPLLLSRTIAANARRKLPLPMPNPPYTPLIEGITLNYRAAGTLRPGRPADDDGAQPEKLFHLYPFGVREIHPAPISENPTVLPRFVGDGNLYIGIEGGTPGEAISLLFHLREEAAAETPRDDSPATWRYLAGDEWLPLPADRMLDDGTGGFLTSGIVQLILPDDIDREHCILASGKYWLCISTNRNRDRFAGLYGVHAQALSATRVFEEAAAAEIQSLPAGTVKAALQTIAGLAGLEQIGPSFGMRPAEGEAQMYTRMGERLHHKNRAATAWDVERLVLEEFPHVFKAKCLPHTVSPLTAGRAAGDMHAGHLLVAVLPMRFHADSGAPLPHLNAIEIERIRDHLQRVCSGAARVAVRNAAYERIQVRCTVELMPHSQVGLSLQAIHASLDHYLSPWSETGNDARFDWTIRCKDVEAHLRTLPCVRNVAGLSLLRISEDDFGDYRLADTARMAADDGVDADDPGIRASWPWSIAASMDWHLIEVIPAGRDPGPAATPRATGIGRLTVGGNYIVGSSDD